MKEKKLPLDISANSGGEHGNDGHGAVSGKQVMPSRWMANPNRSQGHCASASGSLPLTANSCGTSPPVFSLLLSDLKSFTACNADNDQPGTF